MKVGNINILNAMATAGIQKMQAKQSRLTLAAMQQQHDFTRSQRKQQRQTIMPPGNMKDVHYDPSSPPGAVLDIYV